MRALVTGASGFIGSHLAERLVFEGWRVRCLVRRNSSIEWLRGLPVELITDDLTEPRDLSSSVAGVDAVFHAAGVTKAPGASGYFAGNLHATRNLLDACARRGSDHLRFIHVSSLSAAGPSMDGRPLTEEGLPNPVSWYGQSKLLAEEAVREWGQRGRATIIRPPIVYGPRDRDFLQYFKWADRGVYPMIGRGHKQISLVHVDDLVKGILAAAGAERAAGRTYFISGDGDQSWASLGDTLARVLNRRLVKMPLPIGMLRVAGAVGTSFSLATGRAMVVNADKMREANQPNWLCSNRKAREELGFQPAVSLEEGLAATAHWYRRAGWL